MAAISVKRSISTIFTNVVCSPHFIPIRKTRITRMIRILGTRMSWFKDDLRVTLLTRLTGMTGMTTVTSYQKMTEMTMITGMTMMTFDD